MRSLAVPAIVATGVGHALASLRPTTEHRRHVRTFRKPNPSWTPLFGVAAAVLTETGGLLSHAAIVAREQGLPAVLAVPDATTTLLDGAIVTVDGDSGQVHLNIDRPQPGLMDSMDEER